MPRLKRNLISVGQLDDDGHVVTFTDGLCKISKGAMVVARGMKLGTLYMTTNNNNAVAVANQKEDSHLRHRRLGHMSEKGMKVLYQKENYQV